MNEKKQPTKEEKNIMKIGIDIRSLLEPERTGVGEYTFQLLSHLFEIDKENEYILFYNSFKKVDIEFFKQDNVKYKSFRYPNKLLNASLKFLKRPRLDKLIGGVDLFFMPNLNFVSLSKSVKKIVTVHDLSFKRFSEFYSIKRRLWHGIVSPKSILDKADRVIAVSENTKKDLMGLYGIGGEKIQVVYSGIVSPSSPAPSEVEGSSSSCAELDQKYNLPNKFILFLGTLEPRKNVEGIIEAFTQLKDLPEYHLVIAGPKGWKYKSIFKIANRSQVAKRIHFVNYIKKEDKKYFYQKASLFVYPSFYEGFGFPPLEAMAAGCPVIASNTSSLPEVVSEAGLLVDPHNVNELAQAMSQILQNEDLRNKLIVNGKEQVQIFNWRKTAEQTLQTLLSF